MKKLSKLVSGNFIVLSLLLNVQLLGQCVYNLPVQMTGPNGTAFESKNGYNAPVIGTYRSLVIFAEIDYGLNTDPNPGNATWPAHSLPSWANDVFDLNSGSIPNGKMTRYFHQASFGELNLLGDVLINPNNPNGIFQVQSSQVSIGSGDPGITPLFSEINSITGGAFLTAHGLAKSDFDAWTNTPPGLPKISPIRITRKNTCLV